MPQAASALENLSQSLTDLVARAGASVVSVASHHSRASGFLWRPGLIVTAEETLAEDGEVVVGLSDGRRLPAERAGRDPSTDVALLRIAQNDLLPAQGTSERVRPGTLALALGARDGHSTAALGMVALAAESWQSSRGGTIDARIELNLSPGRAAEGGLAVDVTGKALGMVVFGPRRRVLVIPYSTIDRVAARLAVHGRIARGFLGVRLQPVEREDGGTGAMVLSVDKDGPAAAAGIHQGDILAAWQGKPIHGVADLVRELGPDSVGSSVRLSLTRSGAALDVDVTIGERAQE